MTSLVAYLEIFYLQLVRREWLIICIIATFIDSQTIGCVAPPSSTNQRVRMRLLVLNNYLIETSYLYFTYEDSTQITALVPNEGFIAGGNNVSI